MASRLYRLSAHVSSPPPPTAAARAAGTAAAAAAALDEVAVVAHTSNPAEGVDGGHVHPDICRCPDGTLVIVYAANEDDSPGKDVLMCTRSVDDGASWTKQVPIPCSRSRPPSVKDTGVFEVYPGTLTLLPDGSVLLTWDYYQSNGLQGRALLYTTSDNCGAR